MRYETKLRKSGNSVAANLHREALDRAGLRMGDEVEVAAEPGRIIITRADSPYARAMAAYQGCKARYGKALAELAK
jgi:putative addiction module antidote